MDEIIIKENINIENMIYVISGIEVMLDSDLAKLYHVETKRINEVVNRNPNKFPKRFSWVLTELEWESLRSQFATLKNESDDLNLRSKISTSSSKIGQHRKYLPRVFTE